MNLIYRISVVVILIFIISVMIYLIRKKWMFPARGYTQLSLLVISEIFLLALVR